MSFATSIVCVVRAGKAIGPLGELKTEAETAEVKAGSEYLTAWKGKVRGVLVAALGDGDHLIGRFDDVSYSLMAFSSNTPEYAFERARHGGIRDACGD